MGSPLERIVRSNRTAGIAGDLADTRFSDKETYINDDPRAAQVDTLTTPADPNATPGSGYTYTLKIDGVLISFTDDGTATRLEVAEGVRDAINAEQLINGTVVATATATATVVTARVAGEGFTTSEVDANLTLVNTNANDEADPIGFGVAVQLDTFGADSGESNTAKKLDSAEVTNTATADALIVGVTLRDKSQELDLDSDSAQYAPHAPMTVLSEGHMYVAIEADLVAGSTDVYVRTTADGGLDNIGGFAPAAGTGLVQWSNAKFVRQAGDSLAVLKVDV